MRVVWAVVFAIIGIDYARTSGLGALGFTAVAIAYLVLYGPINRYIYLRQTRGVRQRHAPGVGRVVLGLSANALTVDGSNGTVRLEYAAVRRIEESPTHYFLYVGPAAAIVVPRDRVAKGDPEAFVHALRSQTSPT